MIQSSDDPTSPYYNNFIVKMFIKQNGVGIRDTPVSLQDSIPHRMAEQS